MPSSNIEPPFPAYAGTEPFIFVSYSHKDIATVFPFLTELKRLGYQVWYDEGIDPGNEWPAAIASALEGCTLFIVFITGSAVASRNVKNEIHLALKLGKAFLPIHLHETPLPRDLDLSMGTLQAVHAYNLSTIRLHEKIAKKWGDALSVSSPRQDDLGKNHSGGFDTKLPTKVAAPTESRPHSLWKRMFESRTLNPRRYLSPPWLILLVMIAVPACSVWLLQSKRNEFHPDLLPNNRKLFEEYGAHSFIELYLHEYRQRVRTRYPQSFHNEFPLMSNVFAKVYVSTVAECAIEMHPAVSDRIEITVFRVPVQIGLILGTKEPQLTQWAIDAAKSNYFKPFAAQFSVGRGDRFTHNTVGFAGGVPYWVRFHTNAFGTIGNLQFTFNNPAPGWPRAWQSPDELMIAGDRRFRPLISAAGDMAEWQVDKAVQDLTLRSPFFRCALADSELVSNANIIKVKAEAKRRGSSIYGSYSWAEHSNDVAQLGKLAISRGCSTKYAEDLLSEKVLFFLWPAKDQWELSFRWGVGVLVLILVSEIFAWKTVKKRSLIFFLSIATLAQAGWNGYAFLEIAPQSSFEHWTPLILAGVHLLWLSWRKALMRPEQER